MASYSLFFTSLWVSTSLMANAPITIGTKSSPSISTTELKVNRAVGFSNPKPTELHI